MVKILWLRFFFFTAQVSLAGQNRELKLWRLHLVGEYYSAPLAVNKIEMCRELIKHFVKGQTATKFLSG